MTAEQMIERSISHTEIVTAPYAQELAEALSRESEDSVDAGEVVEYWGTTDDGQEWRCHLSR